MSADSTPADAEHQPLAGARTDTSPDDAAIADTALALLAARRPGATICPSEVARALVADEAGWRALMPAVRAAAAVLADQGRLQVMQRGQPVDPRGARGAIRLRLPPRS